MGTNQCHPQLWAPGRGAGSLPGSVCGPCGYKDVVAGALCREEGDEGAHCISAACLEPSGANDFPRLLLRVGFEFPSQR